MHAIWIHLKREESAPVGFAGMLADIVAVLVTGGHVSVYDLRLHLHRRGLLLVLVLVLVLRLLMLLRRRLLLLLLSWRREMHHRGRVLKLRRWRQRGSTRTLLGRRWDGILVALTRMGIHDRCAARPARTMTEVRGELGG